MGIELVDATNTAMTLPLWRYLDVAKLAHLLKTSRLYLPRLDKLADSQEGRLRERWEPELRNIHASGLRQAEAELRTQVPDVTDDQVAAILADPSLTYLATRHRVEEHLVQWFVSSWHANPEEDMSMWQIYAGRDGLGAALRSSTTRLQKSVSDNSLLGVVAPVDYRGTLAVDANFAAQRSKDPAYEFEREVRLLIEAGDSAEDGLEVEVKLSDLIEEIVISPLTRGYEREAVTAIVGALSPSLLDRTRTSRLTEIVVRR